MRVNGAAVEASRTNGKVVRVWSLRGRKLRTISLSVDSSGAGGSLVVILRRPGGKLAIPLR